MIEFNGNYVNKIFDTYFNNYFKKKHFVNKDYSSKIVDNWEFFPFKLDYIIYRLYSLNAGICDIYFKKENDVYKVCYFSDDNKEFENHKFTISETELFNYFKVEKLAICNFSLFRYETEIFIRSALFRGQKIIIDGDERISLRLVSNDHNFNEFSQTLTKYCLFIELNEKLSNKKFLTKKNKKLYTNKI